MTYPEQNGLKLIQRSENFLLIHLFKIMSSQGPFSKILVFVQHHPLQSFQVNVSHRQDCYGSNFATRKGEGSVPDDTNGKLLSQNQDQVSLL